MVLIGSVLNTRLTSLVLLPDYVVETTEFSLIHFHRLSTITTCGATKAVAEVRYLVNPSTITENDIDKDNITVRYNDPEKKTVRGYKMPVTKAKFKSLANEILTVAVSIDVDNIWTSSDNYLNRLALSVPVKDQSGVVATSDWADISYEESATVLTKKPETGTTVTNDNLLESDLTTLKGKTFDNNKDFVLEINETY